MIQATERSQAVTAPTQIEVRVSRSLYRECRRHDRAWGVAGGGAIGFLAEGLAEPRDEQEPPGPGAFLLRFTLPAPLVDRLRVFCADWGLARADAVRYLLAEGLHRMRAKAHPARGDLLPCPSIVRAPPVFLDGPRMAALQAEAAQRDEEAARAPPALSPLQEAAARWNEGAATLPGAKARLERDAARREANAARRKERIARGEVWAKMPTRVEQARLGLLGPGGEFDRAKVWEWMQANGGK